MEREINICKRLENEKNLNKQLEQIEYFEKRLLDLQENVLPLLTVKNKQINDELLDAKKLLNFFNLS